MSYDVEYKYKSNLIGGFLQTSSVNVDPNGKYYTYDGLERLVEVTAIIDGMQVYTESYTYVSNDTNTSSLVATHTVDGVVYAYTYDNVGNITSVKVNGVLKYRYHYDGLGQLDEEWVYSNGGSEVYEYLYDKSGNITAKNHHYGEGLTNTDTITYTYGNTTWGDLLTNYNGTAITYDAIGNPLRWRNGANVEWNGRQMTLFAVTNGVVTSYVYNSDGIRTQKIHYDENAEYVGVTKYTLDGNKIVAENRLGTNIYYTYDDKGAIMGMVYGGQYYMFSKNVQGDIIGIYNENRQLVAKYEYSAFGEITAITDASGVDISSNATHIANINPFRYRGCYYDTETGFYYLQSRYYDPVVGRFISADNELAGIGGDVRGYNLFAYSMNNPVNMSDPTGNWPRLASIIVGAVVAVAAVAVTVATLGAAAPAAACTLTSVGMSIGASYAVASTVATVAVATTTVVAAAYAGDIAYSSVTGDSLLLDTVFQGNTDAYNAGLTITSIATSVMFEMAAQSPGVCFVAGTPVLAACGYIAIEEVKVGDMVWAENPETSEKELKEVVQTFVNETNELVYVYVNGEEIVTTPEHPFYSPIKGWIVACKLRAGDILVLQNGKYVAVEKVHHEILETPITVYNFEVADFHTYYVGKSAVLVHNDCGKQQKGVGGKGWRGDKSWRDNVSTAKDGGDITSLKGGVPTKEEALQIIKEAGGTNIRVETGHKPPNPHTYPHINYTTKNGVKGTIKIFDEGE